MHINYALACRIVWEKDTQKLSRASMFVFDTMGKFKEISSSNEVSKRIAKQSRKAVPRP